MMGVQNQSQYTTLADLAEDITDILHVYRSTVLAAIVDHIDECGDIFIGEVKKVSPHDTGEYRDSWALKKKRKQKFSVYVGNTKKVLRKNKKTGEREKALPLINILEFSSKHKQPHVGTALNNSEDQIVKTIANAIEKESK